MSAELNRWNHKTCADITSAGWIDLWNCKDVHSDWFLLALSFVMKVSLSTVEKKREPVKSRDLSWVLGMHFLSARLQARLLQYPEIHRSPCYLPKLYDIPCLSNNCDKNSMWFQCAFRTVPKEDVQWHTDMAQLPGIMHSDISLQIGQ